MVPVICMRRTLCGIKFVDHIKYKAHRVYLKLLIVRIAFRIKHHHVGYQYGFCIVLLFIFRRTFVPCQRTEKGAILHATGYTDKFSRISPSLVSGW